VGTEHTASHQADGLRAGFEVPKRRTFDHGGTLRNRSVCLKPVSSDKTLVIHVDVLRHRRDFISFQPVRGSGQKSRQ
jgi:hypothetical protein